MEFDEPTERRSGFRDILISNECPNGEKEEECKKREDDFLLHFGHS